MVVALATVVGILVLVDPVGAHALLAGSSPANDAVVEVPPTELLLEFDEAVEVATDGVRLLDPSGGEVPDVVASASGPTVRARFGALEQSGSYTVNWAAVSADGHPIRGAYLFHLRERTLDAPAATVESGTPLSAILVRSFGAALALAGVVAVFAAWFGGTSTRRRWIAVLVGAALGAFGAVLAVGGLSGGSLRLAMDTTSGRMTLVATLVAVAGLVASRVRPNGHAELALASAATVALAAQGHAVSIPPVALSAGLTVLHVAAAVTWGTTLVWFERRSRTASPFALVSIVRRSSPWGIGAVVLLAVSGAALTIDRAGFDELTSSTYGRLSLVKVALLAVAVVVAARNRWWLAPRLDVTPTDDADVTDAADVTDDTSGPEGAGDPSSRTDRDPVARLRGSVRAEVVVLAAALLVGAVLAQVAPPAAPAGATGGSFVERMAFGDGEVELTVDPGRRGTNEMHVIAIGADGRLMAGIDDLTLALTLPADGVGPLAPEMQRISTGHSVSYGEFPLAGEWTVEVTARPSKFEELRATFTVPIGE